MDEQIDDETFIEISALVLSLNRNTFDALATLESFSPLISKLTHEKVKTLDSLYKLQHSIIKHFSECRSVSNIHHLHDAFSYLKDETLLDTFSYEKLISLFDPSLLNQNATTQKEFHAYENFHADKEAILTTIDELEKLLWFAQNLEPIVEYLNSQTFSIGITGVMNAGKSTMLNALMGKELLGTSIVPETANLTVVKYSQTPSAKVLYWNEQEWSYIQKSAQSINAMAKFVKETQKRFKGSLDKYILPNARVDEIAIEKLSEYTSANDKKSNLVKSVELGTSLEFLEDGVEIVDTPGLDDMVIQREQITKEYLSKCDVTLHLMNVSQSATLKDVEFIIDAVLYQNVSKVLIVVTRIDMVSPEDVAEVIEYTKNSIASRLHEQNADSKLNFVLKTLHFVALSGKMALLHKTGESEEAINAGYTLEQTGILEVEEYIKETLFGKENSRSSLIIHSARSRLKKALNAELVALKYENSLLFKTKDEVDEELRELQATKTKRLESFELLKRQISGYEVELSNYLSRLQIFLDNELKTLQGVLKQRLIDETTYTLAKRNLSPELKDVQRIIQSALKHGLMDIIREYRYKFVQKSTEISEIIRLQFDDIKEDKEGEYGEFDHNAIFGDSFERGFLTSNYEALLARVSKLLTKASLKKMLRSDEELALIIKDEFISIHSELKSKAQNLSEELLGEFIVSLNRPIMELDESLEKSETMLQNHIKLLKENTTTREVKSLELYERIKYIELVIQRQSS